MADSLDVDVDASALLALLAQVGRRAFVHVNAAAAETAGRVSEDARARLARQTAGTGQTAAAFRIDEIAGGYRVYVGEVSGRARNVPYWLEFGTQRDPRARDFMGAAARLEAGPHLRRVSEALQDALDEAGA